MSTPLFVLGGYQLNKTTGVANGAYYFIWFWLAAAIVNGIFGTVQAGIPINGVRSCPVWALMRGKDCYAGYQPS